MEREFEGQGYGAFKQAVGEAVAELLAPVRERYAELRADEDALERTLRAGAERAREIAVPTMAEVHSAMGLGASAQARAQHVRRGRAKEIELVIPITRHMKALDRPLVRPLLIVLLATLAWTVWAADLGVNL